MSMHSSTTASQDGRQYVEVAMHIHSTNTTESMLDPYILWDEVSSYSSIGILVYSVYSVPWLCSSCTCGYKESMGSVHSPQVVIHSSYC